MFTPSKFITPQSLVLETVLQELRNGRKQTHWMWYVFPQLKGLGKSQIAGFYGIAGLEEAREYWSDPVLKVNYEKCLEAVLFCGTKNAGRVFGYPDAWKFQSSLTLFVQVDPENVLIKQALDVFYDGLTDENSIIS